MKKILLLLALCGFAFSQQTTTDSRITISGTAKLTVSGSAKLTAADNNGGVIKYDQYGNPNVMVWIPAFNWSPTAGFASDKLHPAFMVDGTAISGFWCSKYKNVLIDNSTKAIYSAGTLSGSAHSYIAASRANQASRHTIDFDAARKACTNMGTGWHLLSNAEWAAIAIWCKENSKMPYGNNSYGDDTNDPTVIGNIIAGDTFGSGNSRWYGGSGGIKTSHDRTANGIYDMNGNMWEWVDGLCLIDGLIMVAGNANTSPTWAGNSFAATEDNWYNTGMYVKWAGGSATKFTLGTGGRDSVMTEVKSQYFGTTTGADSLCKTVALGPTSSSAANYGNDYFYVNNNGTFFPRRSGDWIQSTNAGVFFLILIRSRAYTSYAVGFRSALVE